MSIPISTTLSPDWRSFGYYRFNAIRRLKLHPETFDDDYEQRYLEEVEKHDKILAQLRWLEAEYPEVWCNMPWSKARAEWERTIGYKNEPLDDPSILHHKITYTRLRNFAFYVGQFNDGSIRERGRAWDVRRTAARRAERQKASLDQAERLAKL